MLLETRMVGVLLAKMDELLGRLFLATSTRSRLCFIRFVLSASAHPGTLKFA